MEKKICPRDGSELTPTRFLNLLMDACPQCDGTWLDRGELAQILGSRYDMDPRHGLQEDDPRGEVRCPGCGTRMVSRWFSHQKKVKVDRCPACYGVWLDSQELGNILKESYQETRAWPEDPSVFVSASSKRFHVESCRSLNGKEVNSLPRSQAVERGLEPCRTCNP